MDRVRVFKSILWAVVGLGSASLATRFLFGLGSVANMNDAVPWGFWKGFNVFPGIALAGGGFVMTALIYVIGKEEYHKYARVSVLLALLGYLTAATALVTELGLPWMVWHPIIYWQHHSALFEVSWCVMLYLTVLVLEFMPVPLEDTGRFAGVRRFLTKYRIILVFLGIMISTLHQSSLGTMWLITPEKLHPLWYTPLLPILFLISAVAVGPMMLILAVLVITYLYRKEAERGVLSRLALLFLSAILVYGLVRFTDLAASSKLSLIFDGSWQSAFFLTEVSLMIIIPLAFLGISRLRHSNCGLWAATLSAVLGLGFDRANIAGIVLAVEGPAYTPTIFEILISLAIISAAILAFLFGIERFSVWETKWEDSRQRPESRPVFGRASEVWLGAPRLANRTMYSLVFVIFLAIGFAIIPSNRIYSGGIRNVIAEKARGGDTLFVDGNRDGYGAVFDHQGHLDRNGGENSCALCHHMNLPDDRQSGCHNCHRDMYQASDAFRHDWHARPDGGGIPCAKCHEIGGERLASTAAACDKCHTDLFPPGATIEVRQYMAPSYTDAMHGLCVECHDRKAGEFAEKPDLALCTTCHEPARPEYMKEEFAREFTHPSFNHVIIPDMQIGKEGK